MHHPGHKDNCTKCIINRTQIAALAPVLAFKVESDAAVGLAIVAEAADKFYAGRRPALSERHEPCEHAVNLMRMIRSDSPLSDEDETLLTTWADELLDDLDEMVKGGAG